MNRYDPRTTHLLARLLDELPFALVFTLGIRQLRLKVSEVAGTIDTYLRLFEADEDGVCALELLLDVAGGNAGRPNTFTGRGQDYRATVIEALGNIAQDLSDRVLAGVPEEAQAIKNLVQDAVVSSLGEVFRSSMASSAPLDHT